MCEKKEEKPVFPLKERIANSSLKEEKEKKQDQEGCNDWRRP